MVLFQRQRTENLQATTDNSLKTEIPFDNTSTIFNNKKLLFSSLILFRLFNALITKTYFNPDEYWQSVEVAHYMVFGYGYLTWEWKQRIRSFAHPLIFATLYKVLALLGLDDGNLFIYAPRLLQAVFAAINDFYSYLLAKKLFNNSSAKWTLFCSIISWFNFFCSVRTFSNSIETSLTIVALFYWPWPSLDIPRNQNEREIMLRISLSLAAISCIFRPTNVIIWSFLGIHLLWKIPKHTISIVTNTIVIFIIAVTTMIIIDYKFYGTFVFVPLNFLHFNIFKSISLFYGTHPWHWYFSQGLLVVLTTLIPFVAIGIYSARKNPRYWIRIKPLLQLCIWVLLCYSLLGHKEFRFIYPLLPIFVIISGIGIDEISSIKNSHLANSFTNSKKSAWLKFSIIFLVITNVPIAYYASTIHQSGVIEVMNYLRDEADKGNIKDIGFLAPCHSTPFYSNLHRNLKMWFLTCEPPLNHDINLEEYLDEADQFYKNPLEFIYTRFEHSTFNSSSNNSLRKWPSYLIIFEVLLKDIEYILKQLEYNQCARFFNSQFNDDSRRQGDIIVFCKQL
ncbi:GPI mannosyltransferase 3 [Gigaspora margarita]|uniref:Mannosyltransferase n=1 Tax=Gigaspora margarita TaxID=4874 RepID=A0A8H4A8G7_GIGMA|nr:GPI mannosyltransferase 3 [Gigaspora margarita]